MPASDRRRRLSGKGNRATTPLSLERLEVRTLCTVNSLFDSLRILSASYAGPPRSAQVATVNSAPSLAKPITVVGGPQVRGTEVSLTVLGKDDRGEAALVYCWKVTQAPAGGVAAFSTNNSNVAKTTKATFSQPGVYNLQVTAIDKQGLSVTSSQRVTVTQTSTSLSVVTAGKQTIGPNGSVQITAAAERFTVKVLDQFGKPLLRQPSVGWTLLSAPSGGKATVSVSNADTVVQFNKAGVYKLRVAAGHLNLSFSVHVGQRISKIQVTPGSGTLAQGASQQFSATALDQFHAPMASQPPIVWSTTAGTISNTGLLTAPASAGSLTVTAKSGAVTGTAAMTISASNGPFQNASLSSLVTTLYADGSLSRPDVMRILRSTGTDGTVDSTELSDLRYLVSQAATYKMAGYVQVLASNVVNGNAANLFYQGIAAGNLAAGSSASLLTILVDKWFLGTDLPAVTHSSISYRPAAGTLFSGTPSRNDEFQGALGDCYFIAALGAIADRNPAAVANMFIDNGDGTFTVRFYTGTYGAFYRSDGTISDGFTNGTGTADYVTVNRQLPSFSSGVFAYANYGQRLDSVNSPLWIALAEKAYAQWNATGKANRNGTNTYSGIEGGWMATVNAQVLGYNATDYYLTASNKQAMLSALHTGKSVTIGTFSSPNAGGLVGQHAYSVTGYNSSTDTFNLYNPWGTAQPTPLTWAQLQANCSMFVVTDASASVPILSGSFASAPIVRSLYATAAGSAIELHSDACGLISSFHTAEVNALEDLDMFDETEPDDAGVIRHSDWQPMDWQILEPRVSFDLSDEPTSLAFEQVDQVFDDIDALLREALA